MRRNSSVKEAILRHEAQLVQFCQTKRRQGHRVEDVKAMLRGELARLGVSASVDYAWDVLRAARPELTARRVQNAALVRSNLRVVLEDPAVPDNVALSLARRILG